MGYRIEYVKEKIPSEKPQKEIRVVLSLVFFLLFLPGVRIWWQEGWETFMDMLLPGDMEAAAHAQGDLILRLRQGSDLREAVTAFCREVIVFE